MKERRRTWKGKRAMGAGQLPAIRTSGRRADTATCLSEMVLTERTGWATGS